MIKKLLYKINGKLNLVSTATIQLASITDFMYWLGYNLKYSKAGKPYFEFWRKHPTSNPTRPLFVSLQTAQAMHNQPRMKISSTAGFLRIPTVETTYVGTVPVSVLQCAIISKKVERTSIAWSRKKGKLIVNSNKIVLID